MNRSERRRQKKQDKPRPLSKAQKALGIKMALEMAAEHHAAGRFQQAEQVYREILLQDPKNAMAHARLGGMALQFGHPEAALTYLRNATELDADLAPAHCDLGNAQKACGDLQGALKSFERALELEPDFYQLYANIAGVYQELEDYDAAIACYDKLLEVNPKFVQAHFNLGHVYADLGKVEDAQAHYLKALRIEPKYAEAYRSLVGVKKLDKNDPLVARMLDLLEEESEIDETSKMHLEFALAKVHESWDDVDGCFEHLQHANALKKRISGYTVESDQHVFAHIRKMFSDLPWDAPEPASPRDGVQPVFILGMPRSGTSLVEQILASHSQVYGAGELSAFKRAVAPHLKTDNLMRAALDIRKSYLNVLKSLPTDCPVITDKAPLNSMLVGFILLAMPEAKIVHTRRDPRAVCWSNFKTYFPAPALNYSSDLSDVAVFYNLYDDLMSFWEEQFPGRIYTLDYEKLTQDQKGESEKLLAHCGLDWEDACLDFHKTKRAVKTASSGQVRQGLYRGSSDEWRRYEAHLGPMLELLDT